MAKTPVKPVEDDEEEDPTYTERLVIIEKDGSKRLETLEEYTNRIAADEPPTESRHTKWLDDYDPNMGIN